MATNINGLGVEFDSKDSKAQLGKIEVVICASNVGCP
jgi:hypothetical protein